MTCFYVNNCSGRIHVPKQCGKNSHGVKAVEAKDNKYFVYCKQAMLEEWRLSGGGRKIAIVVGCFVQNVSV